MAGIREQIRRPKKWLVGHRISSTRIDSKAMELQTAKEILAEVFGVRISDVEERIQNRYEEKVLWPDEFCLSE